MLFHLLDLFLLSPLIDSLLDSRVDDLFLSSFSCSSFFSVLFALLPGSRHYEALVMDNDTRWDSQLNLLQRLVYFDKEIMKLYSMNLGITADMMLDRAEFDLALGMTFVLLPLCILTKEVQHRNKVTTAYLPRLLDRLVNSLLPGTYTTRMMNFSAAVVEQVEVFQHHLILSIRNRFAWVFEEGSLALAAAYLLPGPTSLSFTNFDLGDDVISSVTTTILDNVIELLPPRKDDEDDEGITLQRALAAASLRAARNRLDRLDETEDPLSWWPQQVSLLSLPMIFSLSSIIRPSSPCSFSLIFSLIGLSIDSHRRHLVRSSMWQRCFSQFQHRLPTTSALSVLLPLFSRSAALASRSTTSAARIE